MCERQRIVTIDGPAGVGKSSVSKAVAALLGFTYLDTGAMYRAIAYKSKEEGIAASDNEALKKLARSVEIELLPPLPGQEDGRVKLDGRILGLELRSTEIGAIASQVSKAPEVRQVLTALQQRLGRVGDLVAEGRDTGTVVYPDAAWKFFLEASPQERMRRRALQLRARGEQVDETLLLAQIIQRDTEDRERNIAPLVAAPDAIRIDSTNLSLPEVIARIHQHVLASSWFTSC